MDWKPVSDKCSTPGCEGARRPGQRDCHACHRKAQSRYRERERGKLSALLAAVRKAGLEVPAWETT